jgi:hypothetical protein
MILHAPFISSDDKYLLVLWLDKINIYLDKNKINLI